MNKSGVGNLVLFLTSILLSLLLVEFALRMFLPSDMDTTWELRIPHPEFGWVLQPDASYHYRMAEDMVAVQHNSKGFHDTEHGYDKPAGIRRIVLLGDSFMEAFSVSLEQTLFKQLEQDLAAIGQPAEVINLGVGGYGTLQEYLVFVEEGRRYQPDIVLLGFYFGNDLRNNSLELESMVNAGSMKVMSRPFVEKIGEAGIVTTRVDYDGALRRYNEAQAGKDTIWHRATEHSAILRAIDLVLARIFPGGQQEETVPAEVQDFVMLGMHYCEEPREFSRAWEVTGQLLSRLDSVVREAGARLVIFTVPAQHEVEPRTMERVKSEFYAPDLLCLDQAPAYSRLEAIAGRLGIEYVNLLPDFRREANNGTDLFRSDRHWNAAGHALAARRLAPLLDKKQ
jgi:hypothetical protein